MKKSWKTTSAGIGAILAAVAIAITQSGENGAGSIDWAALIPAVIAGIGLFFARDNKVTSEEAGAK